MKPRIPIALTLACVALSPLSVLAAEDPMNLLIARSGTLLRSDERLFTLYAVFNTLGYDEAPLARELPFPARRFSPIRQKVRARFRPDPELIQRFEDLFTRAPLPIDRYVRCALSLDEDVSDPMRFCADALGELPGLLEKARDSELYAEIAADSRAILRSFLPKLDDALEHLGEVLKQPPDALFQPTMLFNALDGRRSLRFMGLDPSARADLLVLGDFEGDLLFETVSLIAAAALTRLLPEASASLALEVWGRAFAAAALNLDVTTRARLDPGEHLTPLLAEIERFRTSNESLGALLKRVRHPKR